ncbi:MAG: hypothetical protein AAF654_12120 [Myxococcota bacterium]
MMKHVNACSVLVVLVSLAACGDDNDVPAGNTNTNSNGNTDSSVAPVRATAPTPAINEVGVSINPTLSWTSSASGATFTVSVSRDLAELSAGSAIAASDIAELNYAPPALDHETLYYWRVDTAVGDANTTGDVWAFTTTADGAPGSAVSPSPADGARAVETSVAFSWSADPAAETFNVYLDTSASRVASATVGDSALVASPSAAQYTASLSTGLTYYWRIDTRVGARVIRGTVWTFSTGGLPAAPTGPTPARGSEDVALDTVLSWSEAMDAQSYDVYVGTRFMDVQLANRGSPEFRANTSDTQWLSSTPFEFDERIYWRVDAVSAGGTVPSAIWSFETVSLTRPLRFNGVRSVTVVGTTAVRLDWNAAVDDFSLPTEIVYVIYAGPASDSVDFSTPVFTTGSGVETVTLRASEVSSIAPGATL